MSYTYCPICTEKLVARPDGLKACERKFADEQLPVGCGFVHWDNPVPAVAVLVPYQGGIVLVQRGIEPNKGKWCLPCGFINPAEDPADAARREVKEEAGLDLWKTELLDCKCPVPGKANQIVIVYAGAVAGGTLKAGDDATDAKIYTPNEITPGMIAFPLHQEIIYKYISGRYPSLSIPA